MDEQDQGWMSRGDLVGRLPVMVDMRRSPGRYALWTVLPLTVFVAGTAAVILGPPIFADDDGLAPAPAC